MKPTDLWEMKPFFTNLCAWEQVAPAARIEINGQLTAAGRKITRLLAVVPEPLSK